MQRWCRQIFQLDAAGGDGGHDVAAPDLDGVDPQRRRGAVDQVLAHRIADGVADSAVLRGGRLVEIDHGGACLEVLVPKGPPVMLRTWLASNTLVRGYCE